MADRVSDERVAAVIEVHRDMAARMPNRPLREIGDDLVAICEELLRWRKLEEMVAYRINRYQMAYLNPGEWNIVLGTDNPGEAIDIDSVSLDRAIEAAHKQLTEADDAR